MKRELELHEFPGEHISILPPVPRAAAPGYQARYTEPLVLFVGQLLRGKGVDMMIRALGQCRAAGWRALIIGDGSHRPVCEAVVDELGLRDRVRFTGWVDQDSLKNYYENARVAVIPSLWPEPIATIGLELMQHAIPIVAFEAGGVSDWLIHGENGYLVPLIDTHQMARRIDELLQDPELARRMGADGLEKGKRWHDQESYFDGLRELLAEQARVGVRR
jgi:glycosyltransferase involved in cell wall biosynthesis